MFNTIVRAGAVGAGAAGAESRHGSDSDQMMRFLTAPAPQHWTLLFWVIKTACLKITLAD
jgi:hypothetical protein